MASRPSRTGATDPAVGFEECHCADGENRLIVAEKGKCLIVCDAKIPKKHYVCRPCALGNHTGRPCARYVPDYPRHLVLTCKECGFDGAAHERGSDGQLNRTA